MVSNPNRYAPYVTLLIFGLIFTSVSIVNHYFFRTHAWDLGIYNNAAYDYRAGRFNTNEIIQPQIQNLLSDHFELLVMLFSPLSYILGSATFLWVQIFCILGGAWGIYRYILFKTERSDYALWAMIHFCSFVGVYSALSFDYHNNVIGAMAVPYIFLYFERKKYLPLALAFLWLLISKENMALWAGFLALGLGWRHWNDKTLRRTAGIGAVLAGVYFLTVIKVIVPLIADAVRNNDYVHLYQFPAIGKTKSAVLNTLLTDPFRFVKLLFISHNSNPEFKLIKAEFWFALLASGGVVLLTRPYYALMLLPIVAPKMYHWDLQKWGINYHYSIETAPILTIGLFTLIPSWKRWSEKKAFGKVPISAAVLLGFTIFTGILTLKLMESRHSKWYSKEKNAFYRSEHYKRDEFSVAALHRITGLVPPEVPVCASEYVVPHLAFRPKVYAFPLVRDSKYILAVMGEKDHYPKSNFAAASDTLKKYRAHPDWETVVHDEPIYLLRKRRK